MLGSKFIHDSKMGSRLYASIAGLSPADAL